MRAKDHIRVVKDLNAKHAAKLSETKTYYKNELADLQAQYDALCEATGKQDERISRLLGVISIIKNDRRVQPEWFGQLLDNALSDTVVERPEFPFGEFDNGLHLKGE